MTEHLEIKIEGTDLVLLLDQEDEAIYNDPKYDWGYSFANQDFRARSTSADYSTLLHRVLMNAPKGMVVDHINHNKLDNRKANLRVCTHSQNLRNTKIYANNKSGYKGVYFSKATNKWSAQIRVKQKAIHLGTFDDKKDAALAYNNAAINYFKQFALLNTIN